jgi:membrane protein
MNIKETKKTNMISTMLEASKIFYIAGKRLYFENFTYHASALAFVCLVSLVPVTSVLLYIIRFFPTSSHLLYQANQFIYANFLPASGEKISDYLSQFIIHATQLPMLSILFSLITWIMLTQTIEHAFNDIWNSHAEKYQLGKTLMSCFILMLIPFFIGLSVIVTGYISSFIFIEKYHYLLFLIFSMLINTAMFSILYRVIPNLIISIKASLLGGLVAAILFEIVKSGFIIYVTRFANYELIYGALSVIPIFLLWLYLVWCVILYGALLIHAEYIYVKSK